MTSAHSQARPPLDQPERAHAPCPFCGAEETEPLALFGPQLLTVQMYCQRCHTPFAFVKDDAILDVFQTRNDSTGNTGDTGDKGDTA